MKCIVMCGGFAKRLGNICKNRAKPLLEVGGKTVVEHIIENLESSNIDEIIITTNMKFEDQFRKVLDGIKTEKPIRLFIEKTLNNEEKPGAIGGIQQVIKTLEINDDIVVINGDNVFDFKISDIIDAFLEHISPRVVVYDIKDNELAKNLGVVSLEGARIVGFVEKPANPPSTLISTGCYIFPKSSLPRFDEYLDGGNNKDAQGYFLQWLHKKEDVLAFVHKGIWFDIGNVKSLKAARECFGK